MNARQWDTYADEYHDYIISPLKEGVKNPLIEDIKKQDPDRVVADLGTGRGELLPHLSRFKKVYAVDFSKGMLAKAKKRAGSNVELIRSDLRKLSDHVAGLDMAIAVNSVLHPCTRDVDMMLSQIYASLRPGGKLKAVFPSMEAVIYQFQLVYERELETRGDEKKAMVATRRIVERHKYNFIAGTYTDCDESQKLFYKFELRERLKKAGFRLIRFQKVSYPWEATGDFEDFPGRTEMWDWYVTARR